MSIAKRLFTAITIEKLIVRFSLSWAVVSLLNVLSNSQKFYDIGFFKETGFFSTILVLLFVFIVVNVIFSIMHNTDFEKLVLWVTVVAYFTVTLMLTKDFYYYIGAVFPVALVSYYTFYSWNTKSPIGDKGLKTLFILLFVFFVVFVGGLLALRHLLYKTPCFDFGIFAQVFHNLRTTLRPTATCERDMPLSHFAVHVSPIFYVFLPVYMVFPSPITLQIAQAVCMASGLIPLFLIGRKYKLSNAVLALVGIAYIFYPALAAASFYDFHENAFLTPFILWIFYFMEKDNYIGVLICSLLTCLVKEDAPVYVAVIGMYWAIGRKRYIKGLSVLVLAVVYFIFALWILNRYGLGVMYYRYENYTVGSGGLTDVIKAVIMNPAYVIAQSMTKEKFVFILQMMIPFGFLPLMSRNYSKLILLIPFVLINLMSNYHYQYSIHYQYVLGNIAILTYLMISNLASLNINWRRFIASFCAAASLMLFISVNFDKLNYLVAYSENIVTTAKLNEAVNMIPKNASVAASPFIIPHLYDRGNIFRIPTESDTDYVIFDFRYRDGTIVSEGFVPEDFERIYKEYISGDYELLFLEEDVVAVFRRQ